MESPTTQDSNPAAPPDSAGFLNDYLLFLMAAASSRASAGFHAQARAAGLKVAEWRALACLFDEDGQMITRLARIALMEQSAMTRVIERLEDRGLVSRRGDSRDRRRVRVHLTPRGVELIGTLIPRAKAHEAEVLALIPAEMRESLKPLLAGLLAALPDNPLDRTPEESGADPADTAA